METLEIARYAEPDRISKNLERVELHRSIEGALAQVPPKLRRVLRDHYVSDRSVQQIAKREGIAVGTVLSRLFNARGLLRQAWEQDAISVNQAHEDKVSRTVDEGLGRLASDLKAGRSETLKEFLAAMGRFHRYSWTNTLLIQQQYPSATRVAGYHTWNDLGRHVKRGEKGIMICAPLLTKVKDQPSPTRGTSPRDVDSVRVTGFRAAYVFDIEQTDGRPLPAFAETRGDPETFMDKLKGFVSEQGIRFSYDPSIAPADGLSSGGEIRLRPGQSPAEEFSVLAHELAHETGASRASDR